MSTVTNSNSNREHRFSREGLKGMFNEQEVGPKPASGLQRLQMSRCFEIGV